MSPDDRVSLAAMASRLPPISLTEVSAEADLQTRTDRKYLVPTRVLADVLGDLGPGLAVLEIDGRRVFGYESVYYDTPGLRFFRDHVQGRRLRNKVRTRRYVDSGLTMLEVKEKGARGETVKHRLPWRPDALFQLGEQGRSFVDAHLGGRPAARELAPNLVSRYWRATFVHRGEGLRLTCDVALGFEGAEGEWDVPSGHVLVETKSATGRSLADRILHAYAQRDVSISKYCAGVALTTGAPANRWHRVLSRYLGAGVAAPRRAAMERVS